MNCDNKFSIWCPLVGFDLYAPDRGVSEYLAKIGAKPQAISLFVFNADIIYLHQGMEKEIRLPSSNCNYYGAVRNEIREIQPWTNYALRELVQNLKEAGVEVYFGIMGSHTIPKDAMNIGEFGYVAQQQFLIENEELCIEGKPWTGHTYLLKRFKNGRYFHDFFAEKLVEALGDYGADGVHFADAIFPPCMQLQEGDFSFDMMERFEKDLGYALPEGMTEYKEGSPFKTTGDRADYVWTNLREQWITFVSNEWQTSLSAISGALHENGMKLMVCNAWTSEPFEALYRYGIDYAKVAKAGVDVVCLEQQATTTFVNTPGMERMLDWELYSTSMLTGAYAKGPQYLSMNFLKDSTEEAATVAHLPAALEREIHSYLNWYLLDGEKTDRSSKGYFICLGDAIKPEEWKRVIGAYEKVFEEEPEEYLGAVIGWSDRQIEAFLPEYIRSRRWSAHRLLANINRKGAGVMGLCPIGQLKFAHKDVFIPNADLLTDEELDEVLSLPTTVVLTSIRGKEERLKKLSYLEKFYDEGVYCDEYQSVVYIKRGDRAIDPQAIYQGVAFSKRLDKEDLSGVKDTRIWTDSLVFRKVSEEFIGFIAKLLREATAARFGIFVPDEYCYTLLRMHGGKKRVLVINPRWLNYARVAVRVNEELTSVNNVLDFPAQPIKLLTESGAGIAQDKEGKNIKDAVGFIVKIAPCGIGVVDFQTK